VKFSAAGHIPSDLPKLANQQADGGGPVRNPADTPAVRPSGY
jgi:hypothetical protein